MQNNLLFFLLFFLIFPAFAQRVDEKAISAAKNAFGSSIGGQSIGLYHSSYVRGYSPSSAGNIRIEGLYFDQQASLSGRIISGYTIRVGSNAIGYAFPAPTGIVDRRLRNPKTKKLTSVLFKYGSYGSLSAELDHQFSFKNLSLAGGIGIYDNHFANGGNGQKASLGMVGQWKASHSYRLKGFLSLTRLNKKNPPFYITNGNYFPPKIKRRVYDGFSWTESALDQYNMGIIAQASILKIQMKLGMFFSKSQSGGDYFNLVTNIRQNGLADRLIFANPSSNNESISGELQLIRSLSWKQHQHNFIVSIRHRNSKSKYAGSDSIFIKNTQIGQTPKLEKPDFTFSEQNRDKIKQIMIGIGYGFKKPNQYTLNLGIQKAHYQKTTHEASTSSSLLQKSEPILPYISLQTQFTKSIFGYASYTKGLEESPNPPSNAINRFETFPAINTRQYEVGFVWSPNQNHTLSLGYFDIKKPYLTFDKNDYFGSIGDQTFKGFEVSLKTKLMERLTLLIGGVIADPKVRVNQNIEEEIGKRPVGKNGIYGQINLDYEFDSLPGLSAGFSVSYLGKKPVNLTNQFYIDPAFNESLSARYKFKIIQRKASLQFNLSNLTNQYRYILVGSNKFQPLFSRRLSLSFIMDF